MDIKKTEKIRRGITKYQFLRQRLYEVDVSSDLEFQRIFNGFFRMGRRTETYYRDFYCYLEQHKNTCISFSEVLTYLYNRHHRLEMSFASKLVAIANPNFPIWDSIVTKGHFGIIAPNATAQNRLQKGIEKYMQYLHRYNSYLKTEKAQTKIAEFNALFPEATITDVKKLDFMLWQER